MFYKQRQFDKAKQCFSKLVAAKEKQYGPNAKELIGPMMQLQHLTQSSGDIKEGLEKSLKTVKLIEAVLSELDNKLVMDSGNLAPAEKTKIEGELKNYQRYKIDLYFTIHNLYKIEQNYPEALNYAKEHTKLNLEIYKSKHKSYAYALMLEAQAISMMPNLDQRDALKIINESLQIQLSLVQGRHLADSFLGRIYEEKGHILKQMEG